MYHQALPGSSIQSYLRKFLSVLIQTLTKRLHVHGKTMDNIKRTCPRHFLEICKKNLKETLHTLLLCGLDKLLLFVLI